MMQRVMILGQPGSGKTTLAREMGRRTGLPVVHIDQIHWQSGWVERTREEKTALCRQVHAKPAWIFEGGHSATWPERLERCDTLIWLDIGTAKRLRRVLWRTGLGYGKSRPEMPPNCPEQFNWEFLHYIWRTRDKNREAIRQLVAKAPAGRRVIQLRSNREIATFLAGLTP